eukprot:jgi/Chlat1/5080/Chrsp33S05003
MSEHWLRQLVLTRQALRKCTSSITWLLDQFGVLHDGKNAYPRAVEAVRELHAMGLRLYVLSNSSRRANTTLAKLKPFGFDPAWFAGAVTSGEITYQNLLSRHDPWFATLGRTCLHFTWADRGSVSLEGLDLAVTADPSHADFILAHGTQALGQPDGATPQPRSIAELSALLPEAAAKGIPMIVANPDVVTVSGNELAIMPGTLANMYRELGGVVRLMGKPDPVAYTECMRLADAEHASTVMVGDSLHHDIAGAAAAGIDSIFITSGIHREELGAAVGEFPEPAALQTLFDAHLVHPTHVAPLLAV